MPFTRINLTLGDDVYFSAYDAETNQLSTEEQIRSRKGKLVHFEAATRSNIGNNPIGWYVGYQFFSWARKNPGDLTKEGTGTLDNAFTKRVIALINDLKSSDSGTPFQVVFDGRKVKHLNHEMLQQAGVNFQINASPIKTAVEISLDDGVSFSVRKPKTGEAFTEAQVRETLPFDRLQQATRCVIGKEAPIGWYAGYQFFDWASRNPIELVNEGTGTVDKAFTKRILAMLLDLEEKYGSEGFQVSFVGKHTQHLNRDMLVENGFAFEECGACTKVTRLEGASTSTSSTVADGTSSSFMQLRTDAEFEQLLARRLKDATYARTIVNTYKNRVFSKFPVATKVELDRLWKASLVELCLILGAKSDKAYLYFLNEIENPVFKQFIEYYSADCYHFFLDIADNVVPRERSTHVIILSTNQPTDADVERVHALTRSVEASGFDVQIMPVELAGSSCSTVASTIEQIRDAKPFAILSASSSLQPEHISIAARTGVPLRFITNESQQPLPIPDRFQGKSIAYGNIDNPIGGITRDIADQPYEDLFKGEERTYRSGQSETTAATVKGKQGLLGWGWLGVVKKHPQYPDVAVKKNIRRENSQDNGLSNEYRVGRRVTSPYVIKTGNLYSKIDSNGNTVKQKLVMERVYGTTIETLYQQGIKRTDSVPRYFAQAKECALQLLEDRVSWADTHGGNIFITEDDKLKLIDLGQWKQIDDIEVCARRILSWGSWLNTNLLRLSDISVEKPSVDPLIAQLEGKTEDEIKAIISGYYDSIIQQLPPEPAQDGFVGRSTVHRL